MAAWVNIDRLDHELNAILDSDEWGPGDLHWQLNRSGGDSSGIYGPDPEKTLQLGRSVPLGQWAHHAVVVDLDRPSIRVFVNGELTRESVFPHPAPTLAPGRCRLGDWLRRIDWQQAPKRGLRGRIDEFAVWRRALSQDELRGLAAAGRPSLLSVVGPVGTF
jgi:Concanavalin A-like lectin/glucanases superfamily